MFMVMLILVHASYSEYKEEVNDHSPRRVARVFSETTRSGFRERKKGISRRTIEFSEFATTPDFAKTARKGGWSEVTRGKIIIRAKAGREKMRCG